MGQGGVGDFVTSVNEFVRWGGDVWWVAPTLRHPTRRSAMLRVNAHPTPTPFP